MIEVEVWVLVDEDGDVGIGRDAVAMAEDYAEQIGGDDAKCKRMVKVTLRLPKPCEVCVVATLPTEGPVAVSVS